MSRTLSLSTTAAEQYEAVTCPSCPSCSCNCKHIQRVGFLKFCLLRRDKKGPTKSTVHRLRVCLNAADRLAVKLGKFEHNLSAALRPTLASLCPQSSGQGSGAKPPEADVIFDVIFDV